MIETGIPEFRRIESLLKTFLVKYMECLGCSRVNIPEVLINLTLLLTFDLVLSIFIFVFTHFVIMILAIIRR